MVVETSCDAGRRGCGGGEGGNILKQRLWPVLLFSQLLCCEEKKGMDHNCVAKGDSEGRYRVRVHPPQQVRTHVCTHARTHDAQLLTNETSVQRTPLVITTTLTSVGV
jgi:hypothetical protein